MNKSALGRIVPRGVGSVMLGDVGYIGVTGWYSDLGGGGGGVSSLRIPFCILGHLLGGVERW